MQWIRISDFGLLDPGGDPDVISWSLCHTPALHKISSKSVGNFFDNPVNADFGLRTPGYGRWSGSSPKLNSLVPGLYPTPPRNFVKIRWQLFQLSDGQTDRQTDRSENITSFGGDNYPDVSCWYNQWATWWSPWVPVMGWSPVSRISCNVIYNYWK